MFEVRPVAVSAAEYAQVTGQSFGGAPPVLPGSAVSLFDGQSDRFRLGTAQGLRRTPARTLPGCAPLLCAV